MAVLHKATNINSDKDKVVMEIKIQIEIKLKDSCVLTLTKGTLFLSSWTARLVLETEKEKDIYIYTIIWCQRTV